MADQTGYNMYFEGHWKSITRGDNGQVLTIDSGAPIWKTPSAGSTHNLLSATHPDSVVASVAAGDLVIGNATPKWAALTIGNANELLQVSGGFPVWGTLIAGQIPDLSGTYQPLDSELTAIAGLTSAADRLPYFTGSGTASLATFTAAGRALVDDADADAQRTTLGLGTIALANQANHVNDSTAPDVAGIVADFNQLLAEMQSSGQMA